MNQKADWLQIKSSFIDAIAWSPIDSASDDPRHDEGVLSINIRGAVYAYFAPSWAYALLCSAKARGVSVGRVYSRVIRGRFERVAG